MAKPDRRDPDAWRRELRADVADAALETVRSALVEAAANGARFDAKVWRAFAILHALLHGRKPPSRTSNP